MNADIVLHHADGTIEKHSTVDFDHAKKTWRSFPWDAEGDRYLVRQQDQKKHVKPSMACLFGNGKVFTCWLEGRRQFKMMLISESDRWLSCPIEMQTPIPVEMHVAESALESVWKLQRRELCNWLLAQQYLKRK